MLNSDGELTDLVRNSRNFASVKLRVHTTEPVTGSVDPVPSTNPLLIARATSSLLAEADSLYAENVVSTEPDGVHAEDVVSTERGSVSGGEKVMTSGQVERRDAAVEEGKLAGSQDQAEILTAAVHNLMPYLDLLKTDLVDVTELCNPLSQAISEHSSQKYVNLLCLSITCEVPYTQRYFPARCNNRDLIGRLGEIFHNYPAFIDDINDYLPEEHHIPTRASRSTQIQASSNAEHNLMALNPPFAHLPPDLANDTFTPISPLSSRNSTNGDEWMVVDEAPEKSPAVHDPSHGIESLDSSVVNNEHSHLSHEHDPAHGIVSLESSVVNAEHSYLTDMPDLTAKSTSAYSFLVKDEHIGNRDPSLGIESLDSSVVNGEHSYLSDLPDLTAKSQPHSNERFEPTLEDKHQHLKNNPNPSIQDEVDYIERAYKDLVAVRRAAPRPSGSDRMSPMNQSGVGSELDESSNDNFEVRYPVPEFPGGFSLSEYMSFVEERSKSALQDVSVGRVEVVPVDKGKRRVVVEEEDDQMGCGEGVGSVTPQSLEEFLVEHLNAVEVSGGASGLETPERGEKRSTYDGCDFSPATSMRGENSLTYDGDYSAPEDPGRGEKRSTYDGEHFLSETSDGVDAIWKQGHEERADRPFDVVGRELERMKGLMRGVLAEHPEMGEHIDGIVNSVC